MNEPIARALAELDDGPHYFRLGGGTVLASRWTHRDSFDLDLVVNRDIQLTELANPANPFDLAMRALEGVPEYERRQCTVTFPSGQVDLIAVDPQPSGAEHLALVNGTPVLVLDTAQILHGKLERSSRTALRDVFDLITAADLDPDALARAVNCRTPHETEISALAFEQANSTLERDSRQRLHGAGEIADSTTLGTQAGNAIRDAVYRHVTIRTEGPLAVVETTTNNGRTRRIEMNRPDIDRAFAESGISRHLAASGFGAPGIQRALHDACARGHEQTVWETGSARG